MSCVGGLIVEKVNIVVKRKRPGIASAGLDVVSESDVLSKEGGEVVVVPG